MSAFSFNRRTFLRTAAASLVLPSLESFGKAAGVSPGATPPTRFAALYFPNGSYPTFWTPEKNENGTNFQGALEPLSAFRDQAVTFSNINHPFGGHLGQVCAFLTGSDLRMTPKGVLETGTSLDQIIARKIGNETYLSSLQLGMEPPSQGAFGNRPRSFGNSISWSSPSTKIEPQISPQLAFDQVFYGQTPEGKKRAARQKRLIDHVWDDAKTLQSRVSSHDSAKLEQYYDSIRDLEAKLERTIDPIERDWTPQSIPDPIRPTVAGIPEVHTDHMRMLMDILVLALQTDSTRVATFVLGHEISRIVFSFADSKIRADHHNLSHHKNSPEKIAQYNLVTEWFATQTAYMLEKMRAIPEGEGTLLDHSLVLYGSGMKDGNTHDPVNVPIALFGGASGRIKTGQHISCPEGTLLTNLHVNMQHVFGIPGDEFNGKELKPIPGLLV